EEEKKAARRAAYNTLWERGVSATGDIANTTDSLDLRTLGQMYIHSFIEAIGFNESTAENSFEYALSTYRRYQHQSPAGCSQSIVPHAPYSVSRKLFGLINAFEETALLSIHNQESEEENKFYKEGSGAVQE